MTFRVVVPADRLHGDVIGRRHPPFSRHSRIERSSSCHLAADSASADEKFPVTAATLPPDQPPCIPRPHSRQELCGIYTPEENSVKSSRFAGVSEAPAEREPAGEILSPNFGRRIPRRIAKSPKNQRPCQGDMGGQASEPRRGGSDEVESADILTFSRHPGND